MRAADPGSYQRNHSCENLRRTASRCTARVTNLESSDAVLGLLISRLKFVRGMRAIAERLVLRRAAAAQRHAFLPGKRSVPGTTLHCLGQCAGSDANHHHGCGRGIRKLASGRAFCRVDIVDYHRLLGIRPRRVAPA